MKPLALIERLGRSIPSKMLATWIESVHAPNRELCERVAAELCSISGSADEAAATRHFASQSARDAFVLHFISGRLTSVLVFMFDLHRTERHLSNLAGTVILMHQPGIDVDQWREQSLNYLADVSPDAPRRHRSRKLFRRMLVRNGAQALATRALRRTLEPKGIVGHLSMSGAHALWSYGEIVMAQNTSIAKPAQAVPSSAHPSNRTRRNAPGEARRHTQAHDIIGLTSAQAVQS